MRSGLSAFLFLCCALGGYFVSVQSWRGTVYVYIGELRAPASVRTVRDYSAIDRSKLFESVHHQMLSEAKLVQHEGKVGLVLGHPLLRRGKSGASDFACALEQRRGVYDRIQLVFLGTGVSESGRQPLMTIEVPCASGRSLNELRTVWIPVQDMMAIQPKDQELQFYGDQPVFVRLEQIPDQWPEAWVLWTVRLFNEANPTETLTIDSDRIREAKPSLLSLDWPTTGK